LLYFNAFALGVEGKERETAFSEVIALDRDCVTYTQDYSLEWDFVGPLHFDRLN